MAKSIIYNCYAYFVIDRPTNIYPIRDCKKHIKSIFSLQSGDIIYIKGIGKLRYQSRDVDNVDYVKYGKDALFQEIAINCFTIN